VLVGAPGAFAQADPNQKSTPDHLVDALKASRRFTLMEGAGATEMYWLKARLNLAARVALGHEDEKATRTQLVRADGGKVDRRDICRTSGRGAGQSKGAQKTTPGYKLTLVRRAVRCLGTQTRPKEV
jgi:hypothetical protein